MFRPRIIPTLLLKNKGIVKSLKFKNHRYIGDPINAVKIFNDSKADELVFLDIVASKEKRTISLDLIKKVGEEAKMPFAVGGGIRDLSTIQSILARGAEKVIIGSNAVNIDFIQAAAEKFGSSTIAVCIDVKINLFNNYSLRINNGRKKIKIEPTTFAKQVEKAGAGELIVQSIDKDGTKSGYDIDLIKLISEAVSIPVIALGGASSLENMKKAWIEGYATAVSAGSLFVYHGTRNGILINYPSKKEINEVFNIDEEHITSM